MRVEYDFYVEIYGGGNVPEIEWNKLEVKAEALLEKYTFGQLPEDLTCESYEKKAKCAICEMMESIYSYNQRGGKVSESNDGYSVTFDKPQSLEGILYDVAYTYLCNTGLMDWQVNV